MVMEVNRGGWYGKIKGCAEERQEKGQEYHEREATGETRKEELGQPIHLEHLTLRDQASFCEEIGAVWTLWNPRVLTARTAGSRLRSPSTLQWASRTTSKIARCAVNPFSLGFA